MARYNMTAKELILTSGSSRGSQIKFYKDGYWYKIDENGPEGKAEEIATKILSCSNLSDDEYVHYESCYIDYENKEYKGCRSKDILLPGEQLLSYEKIYKLSTGNSLTEDIQILDTPEEKIDFVANAIKSFCGLDVREHIAKNLTTNMVLLNTDCHLNNIAIIANKDLSDFRNAPIYDNGASFLSNHDIYPPNITIDEIKKGEVQIVGKPFSASLEYQAVVAGLSVKFDFKKARAILNNEPDSREIRIAKYLVDKYEKTPQLLMSGCKPQKTISEIMEQTWHDYFSLPKNERNNIAWENGSIRPIVFDDMYMAQCQKEGRVPQKDIAEHFRKCMDGLDYTPKYYKEENNR